MTQTLPRGYKTIEFFEKKLKKNSEDNWIRNGKKREKRLFYEMSQDVPAYKNFLTKKGVNVDYRYLKDIGDIPSIDKDNYLRTYKRSQLCWDGKFSEYPWVISTTSGSTGQPYYFPRKNLQDEYLAITTEAYLRANFEIQDKTTLYINAFPMGAWIGGVFTYESIKQISEKGYSISIISPGVHKQEVINAVKQLGNDFEQIIIGAYAPFLKDILDDGIAQNLKWDQYNIGFVFSAEAFTETFRDYVGRVIKPKNLLKATLNHYGTVDLGTMAHETPLSILIRRTLAKDGKLDILFPEKLKQPTFAQYNPELFYFRAKNHNLYCSSFSGIPLVNYDLKDYGGVITKQEAFKKLHGAGYDIDKLIVDNKIGDTIWNLPFVYVYERNDFSVSYYAFLVYPDTIRRALQNEKLMKEISGKFTMHVQYDKSGRQKLIVNIEKNFKNKKTISTGNLTNVIHDQLMNEVSEYRETFGVVGKVAIPEVKLWDYGDPVYFRSGAKQKWVIK
jgi:phenylacetate-CoA ligase